MDKPGAHSPQGHSMRHAEPMARRQARHPRARGLEARRDTVLEECPGLRLATGTGPLPLLQAAAGPRGKCDIGSRGPSCLDTACSFPRPRVQVICHVPWPQTLLLFCHFCHLTYMLPRRDLSPSVPRAAELRTHFKGHIMRGPELALAERPLGWQPRPGAHPWYPHCSHQPGTAGHPAW